MDDLAPTFNIEDDLFSFETDHLALKGNEDYCNVLKTLVVLAAQREKALKDYKTVAELKIEALNDPLETLEKIRNGSDLGIPPLFELSKLPRIDFQKYKVKVPETDIMEIYSEGPQNSDEKPDIKNVNVNNNNNKAWTPEEQKRLEELLQIYPPEPVEMRRFHKIAKALGNKTVHQVASRIQKYFVKLYKAGLPIPGRIPKSAEKYKRSSLHKHQRNNHYLWKPTTFFPALSVPVQMDDLNSIPGPSEEQFSNTETEPKYLTDNYLMRTEYHQTTSAGEATENVPELQLKLLKRVREIKLQEQADSYVPYSHVGYKCDYCDESPITGTRWHCTVCPDSVDFCTDCVVSQMYSENSHSYHHWLALHHDDSESTLLEGFPEPSQVFDKQITEELRTKSFEIGSDSEETSE